MATPTGARKSRVPRQASGSRGSVTEGRIRVRPGVPAPKIQVPRTPETHVDRIRLHQPIDDALVSGRIIVVSAPAGYGKTSLLAARATALRDRGRHVAWVTCDHHDADPQSLWSAILSALSVAVSLDPAGRERADAPDPFAGLSSLHGPMEQSFLASLGAALDGLEEPVVLVLDDAHELRDPVVLAGLDEFLRWLPDGVRVLIGCRYDPPVSLYRMRMAGSLTELRAADLAFLVDETDQLLKSAGIAISAAALERLQVQTEGWPAAVRLAALSLDGETDPDAFVDAFARDSRSVADYLVNEILARQPADVVDFLLDTSVVPEITVDLAARLSGREDAGALLGDLERVNALVTRLGKQGAWFRYHSLLREFLLAELSRRDALARGLRHGLAARWFAAQDLPAMALDQAIASADADLVCDLLASCGLGLLLSGQRAMVQRAVAMVPDRPEALAVDALARLEAGDVAGARAALTQLDAADDTAARERLDPLRRAAHLYVARLTADTTVLEDLPAIPHPARSSPYAPPDVAADVAMLTLANRGVLYGMGGRYEDARTDLTEALELATAGRRDYFALYCLTWLAGAGAGLSDLAEMRHRAIEAIALAEARGWSTAPRMAYAYILAAWGAHLRLQRAETARWAPMAVSVLDASVDPEVEYVALVGEAIIAADQPDSRRQAMRRLQTLWERLEKLPHSGALGAYGSLGELHACLALGEQARARAVVERTRRLLGAGGDEAVLRGVLHLALDQTAAAREAVAPVLAGTLPASVVTTAVTAHLVEAVGAHRLGVPAAHAAVLDALEAASEAAVMRPFYDLGEPVHELLLAAAGRAGPQEDFLAELLTAWQLADEDLGASPASLALLTPREMQILRDLPSMLTVEDLSTAHLVSVNTIKTHLSAIYRKLDVGNRREAVAAARRRGML